MEIIYYLNNFIGQIIKITFRNEYIYTSICIVKTIYVRNSSNISSQKLNQLLEVNKDGYI